MSQSLCFNDFIFSPVTRDKELDISHVLWRCLLTVLQNTSVTDANPVRVAIFMPCQDFLFLGRGILYDHSRSGVG